MYSRTAILKSRDISDKGRLLRFISEIRANSMYDPITETLFAAEGFISKETKFVEQPQGNTCYSSVFFENKELFDKFYSLEENSFVWNYFEIITDQYGIDFSIEDNNS